MRISNSDDHSFWRFRVVSLKEILRRLERPFLTSLILPPSAAPAHPHNKCKQALARYGRGRRNSLSVALRTTAAGSGGQVTLCCVVKSRAGTPVGEPLAI